MAAYKLTYSGNQTGNAVITVPDGSVYSIGNIVLPGQDFKGYGLSVDQNMLSMLEHFASSTAGPNQPVTGQLWYDALDTQTLRYNVSTNATANWAIVPKTDPNGNATFGNVTLTGNVTVDPPGVITGNVVGNLTGNVTGNVVGNLTGNVTGNVVGNLTGNVTGNVVGNLTGNVTGNVVGNLTGNVTGNLTGNVTGDVTGNSMTANYFVGGNIAGTLTTAAQPNITSVGRLTALTVGNATANTAFGNGTVAATGNITGANIIASPGGLYGTLNSTSITTGAPGTAGTMVGAWSVSSFSVAGALTSTQLTTGATATAGSITGQWTLGAGSTLQATYADLAERHHADREYLVGTVMKVGGINEVKLASMGDEEFVIGVISAKYAYLMNGDAGPDSTHPAIAYVGRVPVRIVGAINKGQQIVPTLDGCARASIGGQHGFGWAIETNTLDAEKLVLCIIK